jgi:hypothetical protein
MVMKIQEKKLIAGIVLLVVELSWNISTSRIYYRNGYQNGYPNEHLAGNSDEEIFRPYMQRL